MKITVNMLRNLCSFFLVLRDRAEAEGLGKQASNAHKQYQFYDGLLMQAKQVNGKRPSGVGAGQPLVSHWKIKVKSSLPLTGGVGNGKESAVNPADGASFATSGTVSTASRVHCKSQ
ncbi:hypothetical protein A8L34_22365 [Bacillus sp. FJAT-27264]|uniref:hypothetical protein n=1 Tax=Paenibacillus sp. (strain DSM 101736 / FJAT-27264) TaxID=1850362 RepID=UPI000807C162|nr:hypothetical protein [Bacillus sp. FJAT-27264]OBZ08900.1 hypothetical protein A8L34_22365 [Bacillus sp. FJAT-27264]